LKFINTVKQSQVKIKYCVGAADFQPCHYRRFVQKHVDVLVMQLKMLSAKDNTRIRMDLQEVECGYMDWIVRVIKSRRMRWAGHVACIGEERGV